MSMGLLICDSCNRQMDWGGEHVCKPNDIRYHVAELENRARVAEDNVSDMRNDMYWVLKDLPSLEGDKLEVSGKLIRQLWDAVGGQWYEHKTADSFLSMWLATHRILCEAFDLFRTKKKGGTTGTVLERLKELRRACDEARIVLGYLDSKFDVTPEELVGKLDS